MRGLEFKGLSSVSGPIVILKRQEDVGFSEIVTIRDGRGERRTGRVVDLSAEYAAIQVFGSTTGLSTEETSVEFLRRPMELLLARDMLGRIYDGLGRPMDGYAQPFSSTFRDVNGEPINPYARIYPRDFIQTGISAIDGMNTLIRGQKLPIFSGSGLPHNRLAAQIIRQAKIRSEAGSFVMVFAAMGIKYDVARFFIQSFEAAGVL
ncbi:MAG: V-type ATP synthase subunit B, partial [Spirochaetales bacterium]|nr:V-type ATP synthase subunit B [Spirochaetales bacterium]